MISTIIRSLIKMSIYDLQMNGPPFKSLSFYGDPCFYLPTDDVFFCVCQAKRSSLSRGNSKDENILLIRVIRISGTDNCCLLVNAEFSLMY